MLSECHKRYSVFYHSLILLKNSAEYKMTENIVYFILHGNENFRFHIISSRGSIHENKIYTTILPILQFEDYLNIITSPM